MAGNGLGSLSQQLNAMGGAGGSLKRAFGGVSGPVVADGFSVAKLRAVGSGARQALANPNTSLPVLPDAGAGARAFAQNFKLSTGGPNGQPGAPGSPPVLPPMPTSNHGTANQRVPYTRMLHVPRNKGSDLVDVPSQDDIVIMKRHKTLDPANKLYGGAAILPYTSSLSDYTAMNSNRYDMVELKPAIGIQPIALNYLLAREGLEMFNAEANSAKYNAYRDLRPADVWYGAGGESQHLLQWCGWTMDGVAHIEELGNGLSGRDSDGWDIQPGTGRVRDRAASIPRKLITVEGAGQITMLDVVDSRGLCEGARIWWVLKKFPLQEQYGSQQTYIRSHKSADLTIQTASNSSTQVLKARNTVPGAGETSHYRPFQLAFYATPDGGLPPQELREYVDEWGCKHYDGLVGSVGRVVFAPARMQYKMPVDPKDLAPLTNGEMLMVRDRLTIILDVDKDGAIASL